MSSPPTVVNDYVLGIQYGDFDDDITSSSDYGSGLVKSNCKLKALIVGLLLTMIKMDTYKLI